MTRELNDLGLPCSQNRVARIMRAHGLRARSRRPFRPRTTRPDHAAHPSPNLLRKAAPPDAPGIQIVSDITYIPTHEGWLYLVIILDLFSRAILAWQLTTPCPLTWSPGRSKKPSVTGDSPRARSFTRTAVVSIRPHPHANPFTLPVGFKA
jgi:hypothetical protein